MIVIDVDVGINVRIIYLLIMIFDLFKIDFDIGKIIIIVFFNCEVILVYRLEVVVIDRGISSR